MTDPIADFLTRIRNAVKANHKVVEAPGSKIKQEITKILYEQGYILAYKFDTDEKGHPSIKIALKWDAATKGNAIKDLKRVEFKAINLSTLEELAAKKSLSEITVDTLVAAGFIS